MQQLFSIQAEKLLPQVDKKEEDLQKALCKHWKVLFPQYTFIAQEFVLKGMVHDSDSAGRIDILGYNPDKKRFVVLELKKDGGKYRGLYQAIKYRKYIKKKFAEVHGDAREELQKYNEALPKREDVDQENIEIILIAKEFTQTIIDEAEEKASLITLIEYNWFGNDLLLLDYVHDGTGIKSPSGTKPPKGIKPPVQIAGQYEKEWAKMPHRLEILKGIIAKLPPHSKRRKTFEQFLPFVAESIDKRNAQLLRDKAVEYKKPAWRKYAERILAIEAIDAIGGQNDDTT